MSSESTPDQPDPSELDETASARSERKRREDAEDLEALCRERPELADRFKLLFEELSPEQAEEVLDAAAREATAGGGPELPERLGALLARLQRHSDSASRYQVLEELARGGMGTILRVRQEELDRDLAMKVMLGEESVTSANPRVLSRFLDEAMVTGKLDHPGVVPVHELGIDADDRVFFTMKLVKGRDLEEVFACVRDGEEGWTETRVVGVLQKACEALAYAHQKGVIHRDLKPANIMVGDFGEVYVMDWGLAKVLEPVDGEPSREEEDGELARALRTIRRAEANEVPDSPLMTRDGDVVGTPAYMPPEQAQGRPELLGPHSDIYSMGAILYHLLAGRRPYVPARGSSRSALILSALLAGPPQPLHVATPRVPAELAAICERAMAREPSERYESMLDLASDLRAYLEGRVVRAFEAGALAEFKKWFLRNRFLAGSLAAALLILVVGSIGYALQQAAARKEIEEQKGRADSNYAEAAAVADFLGDLFKSSDPSLEEEDAVTAEDLLDRGAASIPTSLAATPLARAKLMRIMGASYISLGLHEKAEPLLDQAYAELRTLLGPDDPETMGVLSYLGSLYTDQARFEDAERAIVEVLRFQQEHLAPNDRETLTSLNNLGDLYCRMGRFKDAERNISSALEGMRETLGEEDRSTLASWQALGLMYLADGRLDLAEEAFSGVRSISERVLGANDLDTLSCLGNLAAVYRAQERFDDAAELYLRVLQGRRERLHPDHPAVLNALWNLAEVRISQGRLEDAEPLLLEALEGSDRRGHSDRLQIRSGLARLYYRMGRVDEAVALYREVLEELETSLGEDHPDTLATASNLGTILKGTGELEEAELLIEWVFERRNALFGPEDPRTLAVTGALTDLYYLQGRLEDAEPLARLLLEHFEEGTPSHQLATIVLTELEAQDD